MAFFFFPLKLLLLLLLFCCSNFRFDYVWIMIVKLGLLFDFWDLL